MLRNIFFSFCAFLFQASWSVAFSAEEIGIVSAANQGLMVVSEGQKERVLRVGDSVLSGDKIITNDSGNAQVIFKDKSTLTIAANTDITMDEFVYDPQTEDGQFGASISKGTFRFIGGVLSKNKPAKFKTPVAMIGVHGSSFGGTVSAFNAIITPLTGQSTIYPNSSSKGKVTFDREALVELVLSNNDVFVNQLALGDKRATQVFGSINTALASSSEESAGIGFFSKPRTRQSRSSLKPIQAESDVVGDDDVSTGESEDTTASSDEGSDVADEGSSTSEDDEAQDQEAESQEGTGDSSDSEESGEETQPIESTSSAESTTDTDTTTSEEEGDIPEIADVGDDIASGDTTSTPVEDVSNDTTINQEETLIDTVSDSESGGSTTVSYNTSLENYIFGTSPWDSTTNDATRDALDPTTGSVTAVANPRGATSQSYITTFDNTSVIARELYTASKVTGTFIDPAEEGLPAIFFDMNSTNGEIASAAPPAGGTLWAGDVTDFSDITATYSGDLFGYMVEDGTELQGEISMNINIYHASNMETRIFGSWYLDRMLSGVADNPTYANDFYDGHLIKGALRWNGSNPYENYNAPNNTLASNDVVFDLYAEFDENANGINDVQDNFGSPDFEFVGSAYGKYYGDSSSAVPSQLGGVVVIEPNVIYRSGETDGAIAADEFGVVGGYRALQTGTVTDDDLSSYPTEGFNTGFE